MGRKSLDFLTLPTMMHNKNYTPWTFMDLSLPPEIRVKEPLGNDLPLAAQPQGASAPIAGWQTPKSGWVTILHVGYSPGMHSENLKNSKKIIHGLWAVWRGLPSKPGASFYHQDNLFSLLWFLKCPCGKVLPVLLFSCWDWWSWRQHLWNEITALNAFYFILRRFQEIPCNHFQ